MHFLRFSFLDGNIFQSCLLVLKIYVRKSVKFEIFYAKHEWIISHTLNFSDCVAETILYFLEATEGNSDLKILTKSSASNKALENYCRFSISKATMPCSELSTKRDRMGRP